MAMFEIEEIDDTGSAGPVRRWLERLPDRMAQARIASRIARLAKGNFGDSRSVGHGVWELRIDHGPGYRVYYARVGQTVILLLGAGDKRTQQQDITIAIERLDRYRAGNTP